MSDNERYEQLQPRRAEKLQTATSLADETRSGPPTLAEPTEPSPEIEARDPSVKEGTFDLQSDGTWLTIALEEYKQIWAENKAGMQNSVNMLQIGFTLIAALFGSLLFADNPLYRSLLLQWVIPIAAYTILVLWMNEIGRMVRAGNFLRILEERMSSLTTKTGVAEFLARSNRKDFFQAEIHRNLFDQPAMWHTWLRSEKPNSGTAHGAGINWIRSLLPIFYVPQGQLLGGYAFMIALWFAVAAGSMILAYAEAHGHFANGPRTDYGWGPGDVIKFCLWPFVQFVLAALLAVFQAWRISRLN